MFSGHECLVRRPEVIDSVALLSFRTRPLAPPEY